ncbi:hypothetical protein GCM10027018_04070 [Paenibacillus thermoaerophilus]
MSALAAIAAGANHRRNRKLSQQSQIIAAVANRRRSPRWERRNRWNAENGATAGPSWFKDTPGSRLWRFAARLGFRSAAEARLSGIFYRYRREFAPLRLV